MAGEVTPLRDVPGWPKAVAKKLEENWITTAEQLLAMSATADGLRSLAEHVGVSEDRMRQLVDAARGSVAPHVAASLERPANTSRRGLGAVKPPD